MARHSIVTEKHSEHSIAGESIYQDLPAQTSDSIADEPALRSHIPPAQSLDEKALHNVWDEPSLRAGDVTAPPDAITYSRWYQQRRAETTWVHSWAVVSLLALCGGPFAVLGAFISAFGQGGISGAFMTIFVAPVTEEMLKIGVTLIVLENRPYLFRSRYQILLTAIASAFLFAVVENLLYIYVYNPEGNEAFRMWRWTVCTALHVGCTTIAGLGLLHIWHHIVHPIETDSGLEYQRPSPVYAYPYIMVAVLLHGTYNGLVTILELSSKIF